MAARGRGALGRSPPRRKRPEGNANRENHYCLYCKIQFSSSKIFDSHKESGAHKQKETLITKAVADGLQLCYTCESIFPTKIELDAHALMSRHQPLYRIEGLREVVKESQIELQQEKEKSEFQIRRAKDEKVRHEIVMKLSHLTEKEEEKAKNMNNSRFFCDLCGVDCMNETNLKVHSQSWRHRAEVDKKKDEERKKFEEEAERCFQRDDDSERIKVPGHLAERSKYFCEVCSVALSGQPTYLQHLKGKKHNRQVSLMRRPYKCYVCHQEFTNEKDFNHHLESWAHMYKAFQKDDPRMRNRPKKEEWVEKKVDRRENRRDERERSSERDRSRDKKSEKSRDRSHEKSDHRRNELTDGGKEKTDDTRKVEIVEDGNEESSQITDLRERIQGKKMVVNKPNIDKPNEDGHVDPDKRAKELEMEVKFKKLSREYYNDLPGLKERLTKERESDISIYQQYETTYNKLCQEEDYVRENLRVLEEDDPRKEEYIRDMIRIQHDMREVRQELEIREMMIIKRETLFREKFPNSNDNKVVLHQDGNQPVVVDYHHGKSSATESKDDTKQSSSGNKAADDADLRIQLERERLVKRLGPELDMVDPVLRDKLLSVIMDKEEAQKVQKKDGTAATAENRSYQMKMLAAREKELEKELAALKSNEPKKITKSLVPQYDDVEEKGRQQRNKAVSISSNTSHTSSSSSSDTDSRHRKKRRRTSPSKSRSKSKRSPSSERGRKKRRRSSSRERRKKHSSSRRRDEEKKRKGDRSKTDKKKPVKMTLKSRPKDSKVRNSSNPLPGDSNSEYASNDESGGTRAQSINTIPVIGGVAAEDLQAASKTSEPTGLLTNSVSPQSIVPQRREQFSLWKNPSVVVSQKDSPKEDVWDIAFSGTKAKPEPTSDAYNLFNSPLDSQNRLSADILNILKSVAPILQNPPQHNPSFGNQNRLPGEPVQRVGDAPGHTTNVASPQGTSNPTVTPGGRVRSILKKMKEPPKPVSSDNVVETEQTKPTFSPTLKVGGIPGLEYSSDVSANKVPQKTPLPQMSNERQGFDPGERALYGNGVGDRKIVHGFQNPPSQIEIPGLGEDNMQEHDRRDDRWPSIMRETLPENKLSRPFDPYAEPSQKDEDVRREDRSMVPKAEYRERPLVDRRLDSDLYRTVDRDRLRKLNIPPPPDPRDYQQGHAAPPSRKGANEPERRLSPPLRIQPYVRDEATRGDLRMDRESFPRGSYDRYSDLPPPRSDLRYPDVRPAAIPLAGDFDERPPARRAGESEDQYYDRFERYYEIKRRKEHEDMVRRDRALSTRPPADVYGRLHDSRPFPVRPDDPLYRASGDRYDGRYGRMLDDRRFPPGDFVRERMYLDRARPPDSRFVDADLRRLDDRYRILDDRRLGELGSRDCDSYAPPPLRAHADSIKGDPDLERKKPGEHLDVGVNERPERSAVGGYQQRPPQYYS